MGRVFTARSGRAAVAVRAAAYEAAAWPRTAWTIRAARNRVPLPEMIAALAA